MKQRGESFLLELSIFSASMAKDLFFRFPSEATWLVLCLVVGLLRLGYLVYQKRKIACFGSSKSVEPLLQGDSRKTSFLVIGSCCLCIACIVFCLMQPEGNIRYVNPALDLSFAQSASPASASSHQVIFLVDTSQSMEAMDAGQNQSRLDKAKILGEDILAALRGETLSVYAFTSTLTPIVPPTLDPTVGRVLLKNLQVNEGDVGGTDFVKTLTELQRALKNGPSYTAYTLLFFSDGGDLLWEKNHSLERLAEILQALPLPPTFPIRIYSIGMGSRSGAVIPDISVEGAPVFSKLEETPLEQIAMQGGGRFYQMSRTTSADLVRQILSHIAFTSEKMAASDKNSFSSTPWEITDLYYQFPLYLAMLLLFWEIRRDTWLLHLCGLLCLCSPIRAEEISFAESEKALAAGIVQDFPLAVSLYQSFLLRPLPPWQQEAIFYNLGTLQLQQGKIEEALTLLYQISLVPSSPELLLRTLWNSTLATLQQTEHSSFSPEWRLYLSETALEKMQRLQDLSHLDRPMPHLTHLQREANMAWKQSLGDTKRSLLASFSSIAPLYLLQDEMQQLQAKLKETEQLPSLWPLLQRQIATLLLSWPSQIEKSLVHHLQQALKEQDRIQAVSVIEQIQTLLTPFLSSIDPKEQWFFDYRLALLAPVLRVDRLRDFFQRLEEWKPQKNLLQPLEEGLDLLEKQQFSAALFLFVAAYGNLKEAYLPIIPDTPSKILEKALSWQKQAWRLSHLFSYLSPEMATEKRFSFVREAEKEALSLADPFPKALIQWQTEQKTPPCDPSFWQLLLSFFDQGVASAKMAVHSMDLFPPSFPDLLLQQQKSAEAWQKALDRLQQMPPHKTSFPERTSLEQKEALEKLREMELENRSSSLEKKKPPGPPAW